MSQKINNNFKQRSLNLKNIYIINKFLILKIKLEFGQLRILKLNICQKLLI